MADDPFRLADGFAPTDMDAWRALALGALKGAPVETLTATTADGLAVRPLYAEADWPSAADPLGFPGAAPFVRGAAPARDRWAPWDIRQVVAHPDVRRANAEALADLEGGSGSIEAELDRGGRCGVRVADAADAQALLAGVMLDLAPMAFAGPSNDIAAARLFAEAAPAGARLAFNLDPLGALMATGSLAEAPDAALAQAAAFAVAQPAGRTALRADARAAHEAGGTDAQELGALIASGLAWLRAGEAAGLAPAEVTAQTVFTLAVGPDVTLAIAKLRAARLLWARVLEACGAAAPMRLQAVTSRRMMTRRDAWTNMLRTTCAAFAAGVGGADIVTVHPFTAALGLPTAFARRMARNTQIILQEESHLGRVADPAGGAWAMEALAEDLARAAWGEMQAIEAAGGLAAALLEGRVQAGVAAARAALAADVARRTTRVVGVSSYALLGETAPEVVRPDTPPAPAAAGPAPAARAPALAAMRLAAPFEALRDAAEGTGARVFLATLGPLSGFSARALFARNAFEAGGIAALGAEDAHADDDALAAAFAASGATIACLCGAEAAYAARAEGAARALKAAGCAALWLAGRPGEREAALRAAGVDRFVFAGADVLAELAAAHAALRIAP